MKTNVIRKIKTRIGLIVISMICISCGCDDDADAPSLSSNFAFAPLFNYSINDDRDYTFSYVNDRFDAMLNQDNEPVEITYDELDRLSELQLPSGVRYRSDFDGSDRINRITRIQDNFSLRTDITYDDNLQIGSAWRSSANRPYTPVAKFSTSTIFDNQGQVDEELVREIKDITFNDDLTGSFTYVTYVGGIEFSTLDAAFTCNSFDNNLIDYQPVTMFSLFEHPDGVETFTFGFCPKCVTEVVFTDKNTKGDIRFMYDFVYTKGGLVKSKVISSTSPGFNEIDLEFTYE